MARCRGPCTEVCTDSRLIGVDHGAAERNVLGRVSARPAEYGYPDPVAVTHESEIAGVIVCCGTAQNPGLRPFAASRKGNTVAFLLWILAVILVVAGIVAIVRRQLLWGIVLIIVGLLVGPGGVSIFT